MTPPKKEVEDLLETLCIKLGFCLPTNASNRLVKYPPKTPERFAKSVIEAEGLDPELMEKNLYISVLNEIKKVFNKHR